VDRDGNGGMLIEIVSQAAQASDEGLAGGGVSGG
jgi:hypothetical protein